MYSMGDIPSNLCTLARYVYTPVRNVNLSLPKPAVSFAWGREGGRQRGPRTSQRGDGAASAASASRGGGGNATAHEERNGAASVFVCGLADLLGAAAQRAAARSGCALPRRSNDTVAAT